MKNFFIRTLSAFFFAVIMIGGIVWNQYSFIALTSLIAAGCLWEYYGMIASTQAYSEGKKNIYRIFYSLIGLAAFSLFILRANDILHFLPILLPAIFLAVLASELFIGGKFSLQNATLNLTGIVYISIPLGILHFFIQEGQTNWFPGKVEIVFGILMLVWANDTMAYITGSLIGRNKLFPSISPKKTWEGFAGGVVFSLIGGYLLSKYLFTLNLNTWLVIAAIVSIIGTVGDLFESMIKRNFGVKDSGTIMPGHGGFLDRFDAFIFSVPFVFAFLELFA